MKKLTSALVAFVISATSSLAIANPYIGVDYSYFDAGDLDLGAIALKAGYQLTDWVSVEARLGFGIDDDKFDIPELGLYSVKGEIEHYYGAYLRAGMPNETMFYPYAVAGYSKFRVKASYQGISAKENESDFSYGLGARLDFSENWSANLEFMRYMDGDDADAVSLGLMYRF